MSMSKSGNINGSPCKIERRACCGILIVLSMLCALAGVLAVSAAPALAATGNAYLSQFTARNSASEILLPQSGWLSTPAESVRI